MSGLHNKNILFYSRLPSDKLSMMCLQQLAKSEELKKQFILVCVHHPADYRMPPPHKLPSIVVKLMDKIPILAVSGFKKPIFAQEAYTWMADNALHPPSAETIGSASMSGGVADSCSSIDQIGGVSGTEFFNSEYYMGFSDGKGEVGKGYSNIEESASNRIVTYDDSDSKKQASNETQRRLEEMKSQRHQEGPRPPTQQIGMTMPSMPSMPGSMNGHSMPNIPGAPQMPGSMPQMPGNMPQMPSMPRYN